MILSFKFIYVDLCLVCRIMISFDLFVCVIYTIKSENIRCRGDEYKQYERQVLCNHCLFRVIATNVACQIGFLSSVVWVKFLEEKKGFFFSSLVVWNCAKGSLLIKKNVNISNHNQCQSLKVIWFLKPLDRYDSLSFQSKKLRNTVSGLT